MKIRTKREFSGVPASTTGEATRDRNLWKITWDLPGRIKPLVDWFSQDEFEMYMEAV
jgi:hypothetical protein